MACCNPVTHYVTTRNGTKKLVTHGCGKCDGCLKKRQRDWVFRCQWEARKHPYNWIVTLTYKDEFLHFTKKGNATLCKADFQKFMKRLRKLYPLESIRYLVRGEYGGMFGRPHFHVILFGFCCSSVEECGFRLYDQWPYGGVYVDTYSDRAVQYVTDYILKSDDLSVYHDEEIVLPYINVSQRPPIGANFLESKTAKRAAKQNDYILLDENGFERGVPRYLAQKLDESCCDNPFEAKFRKHDRTDAIMVSNGEITHYPSDYSTNKQIRRAEALEIQRKKEYYRNKSKK